MARKENVPSLEGALEVGFFELKKGEGNIKIEEGPQPSLDIEKHKPGYGVKINAKETRDVFVSKPITATKQVVEKPIAVVEEIEEVIVESKTQKVMASPSSKIGDDFDVDW
jgi:hypothetical protein